MMRLMVSAAVFGALVAGGGWYATSGSARIAPDVSAATANDAWPICTTMTGLGARVRLGTA